jgi:hypothetical protein
MRFTGEVQGPRGRRLIPVVTPTMTAALKAVKGQMAADEELVSITDPDGGGIFRDQAPSDRRASSNHRARLRRAGLDSPSQ